MIVTFITVLAWVFGVSNLLILIYKGIRSYNYEGSLEKISDNLNGLTRSWVVNKNILIFALCACWLVTVWIVA